MTYPPQPRPVARQFCPWSIVSIVVSSLAILSGLAIPCIGPILLGIMGAACGHVAENQTRGNAMNGRGLAMVGIGVGWTAPITSMILLFIILAITGGDASKFTT